MVVGALLEYLETFYDKELVFKFQIEISENLLASSNIEYNLGVDFLLTELYLNRLHMYKFQHHIFTY